MSAPISKTGTSSTDDVQGVMINCDGVTKMTGVRFKPFKIGKDHPVFAEPECEVSIRVGMPVKIIRYPSPAGPKVGGSSNEVNQRATFLKRQLDPAKSNFALAPMAWQDPCGNVLAVRSDKKPLAPDALRVLAEFAMIRLGVVMQDYNEGGLEWVVMEAEMTNAAFQRYAAEYEWREQEEGRGETYDGRWACYL